MGLERVYNSVINKEKRKFYEAGIDIIQKYIENPLLIHEKKFDIRIFASLITKGNNTYIAIYNGGFIRLAVKKFNLKSSENKVHQANFLHQHHTKFMDSSKFTDESKQYYPYSLNYLKDYFIGKENVNNHKKAQIENIDTSIKLILTNIFDAVSQKIRGKSCKKCVVMEMFSFDFILDYNFNVFLVDVNKNPNLNYHNNESKNIIKKTIQNTIDLGLAVKQNIPIDDFEKYEFLINNYNSILIEDEILLKKDFQYNFIDEFLKNNNDYKFQEPKIVSQSIQSLKKRNFKEKPKNTKYFLFSTSNNINYDQKYLVDYHNCTKITNFEDIYDSDIILKMYKVNRDFLLSNHIVNTLNNERIWDKKDLFENMIQQFDQNQKYGFYNSTIFYPTSYGINLDIKDTILESEQKLIQLKPEGVWILKPNSANCGKGIQMIYDLKILQNSIKNKKSLYNQITKGAFIVQKYIDKPLLLENKKFDLRVFVMIVNTDPFVVLYSPGYIRRTLEDYNLHNNSDFIHLVNHAVQKKHPDYQKKQPEMHWTQQKWEDYMTQEVLKDYSNPQEQLLKINNKIKSLLTYSFEAGIYQIDNIIPGEGDRRKGNIQLFGCDIMIDSELNVNLIEINKNPLVTLDTQVHRKSVPNIVKEFYQISLNLFENFEKLSEIATNEYICKNYKFLKSCDILINEVENYNFLNTINLEQLFQKDDKIVNQ